jgi:hypothetical protein
MDIIVNGSTVTQGTISFDLPTDNWALDFAKAVEARGLNFEQLKARFEDASGKDILNSLRRESQLNRFERNVGVPASGPTISLAEYRVTTLKGLASVSAKVKSHWQDELDMASDQNDFSNIIDNVTRVLKRNGVEIGGSKADSNVTASNDTAEAGARFEDDDDAEA